MDVGAWIVIPSILSLLLWIEPDISCTERLLYMFFQTGLQGCYHCFFAVFGYHMKQQFHIVPVIARLFPFQIPEPQNNGGVIFRPLSDPDLQVIHAPCLVLMMSFVTYIFPFSGTQLMPAYEFTALFVVQLDMSVILKKPYNGVPIL